MTPRLEIELALLSKQWPDMKFESAGSWVLLPRYPLPDGWSVAAADVAFQAPDGPPGTPPYAFYVNGEVRFQGQAPANSARCPDVVPFPGDWQQFSWAPEAWLWAEDPSQGANLRSFAMSFADRFTEGV